MTPTPILLKSKLKTVRFLYLNKKLSIKDVAIKLAVSPDAIESFIKRHGIPKRNRIQAQRVKFQNKPLSFSKVRITNDLKEIASIGAMLYWAEGYKGNEKNNTLDFANSDPLMIEIFLKFLRDIYHPDEKRFRVYLYCYSNQDINKLIKYWSKVTKIPNNQFSKPYVRSDFRENGRKMEYGMIHVRYHDKKLLLEVKSMIKSYVFKYCVGGGVVNRI